MPQYSTLRLINAIVIGYMVGTREVIGRGGAQAIANLAGEHAGQRAVPSHNGYTERRLPRRYPDDLAQLRSGGIIVLGNADHFLDGASEDRHFVVGDAAPAGGCAAVPRVPPS